MTKVGLMNLQTKKESLWLNARIDEYGKNVRRVNRWDKFLSRSYFFQLSAMGPTEGVYTTRHYNGTGEPDTHF